MDTGGFVSLFSNVWALLLVVVFFGGSIFVHELGHFWAARRCGLKVERFSIGFGPKLVSWTRNGVEYRISLLPLGGYVALPELSDLGSLEGGQGLPKSNSSQIPYLDKVMVLVMGAVFNVFFAFILALILWGVGQPTSEPAQTTTLGYIPSELMLKEGQLVPGPAFMAGLKPGDKVLSIDGYSVSNFTQIQQYLMTGTGRAEDGRPMANLEIERGYINKKIVLYPELVEINPSSKDHVRMAGIGPSYRLVVGAVAPNSPAEKAGLLQGDEVVSVQGKHVYHVMDLNNHLEEHLGEPVNITIKRNKLITLIALYPQNVVVTNPVVEVTLKDANGSLGVFSLVAYSDSTSSSKTYIVNEIDTIAASVLKLSLGDQLVAVNNSFVFSPEMLQNALAQGDSLTFELSGGDRRVLFVKNAVGAKVIEPQQRPMLGITFTPSKVLVYLDPFTQFSTQLKSIYQILRSILSPSSDVHLNHLSSLPGVFRVLHQFSLIDLRLLLVFVLFLNLNLAILNLLPIPVLDGGHILFETIAKLRGRALSSRFVVKLQGSFMFLLFSLMLYISFFDLKRWHGDHFTEKQMEFKQLIFKEPKFTDTTGLAQ